MIKYKYNTNKYLKYTKKHKFKFKSKTKIVIQTKLIVLQATYFFKFFL